LPIARLMEETYKPVILAVNGICAGGGLHFICDSDIAICSENASFFDPHVNVGFVSGWEPVGLSRRIPLAYVLKMVLMGSKFRIDAKKALEIGLVTEVVPPDKLMPRASEIAEIILENSPLAVRLSKKAIMQGLNVGLSGGLENAAPILKEVWYTKDHAEGKRAFAEKRKPDWKAR
ncbi:enoyl-CoA hydratase/isomerase family protein, partial [Chloroflexota bacterium]